MPCTKWYWREEIAGETAAGFCYVYMGGGLRQHAVQQAAAAADPGIAIWFCLGPKILSPPTIPLPLDTTRKVRGREGFSCEFYEFGEKEEKTRVLHHNQNPTALLLLRGSCSCEFVVVFGWLPLWNLPRRLFLRLTEGRRSLS